MVNRWVFALLLTAGCGGKTIVDGTATTSGGGGSQGTCSFEEPEINQICVRGELGADGVERLTEETGPRVELYTRACFSSSCTVVREARCELIDPLSMGARLEFSGGFCIEQRGNECTDDCGGVGPADCPLPALPASPWVAVYDDLEVPFEVPSELPPGGICVARFD